MLHQLRHMVVHAVFVGSVTRLKIKLRRFPPFCKISSVFEAACLTSTIALVLIALSSCDRLVLLGRVLPRCKLSNRQP